ncbi:MAG: hypothetical protein ACMUHY_02775 [Thermoplasmatota archaeon]
MDKEGPMNGPRRLFRAYLAVFLLGIGLALLSAALMEYTSVPEAVNLLVGFTGILLIAITSPVIGAITG